MSNHQISAIEYDQFLHVFGMLDDGFHLKIKVRVRWGERTSQFEHLCWDQEFKQQHGFSFFCTDRGFRQKNRNPPHSEVPLMGQPKARVIGTPLDAKFENAVIKIPNLGDHVFSTFFNSIMMVACFSSQQHVGRTEDTTPVKIRVSAFWEMV
jgi:hypothetical protein